MRAQLAAPLGLRDPGHSWHSERDGIAALAGWMATLCASLGWMGENLIPLAQSDVAEVRISGSVGLLHHATQKENPVGPSALAALARMATSLAGVLQGAALHRQQRDGAAWFTERLALPQLCVSTGRACAGLRPCGPARAGSGCRAAKHGGPGGVIHAEALSFALSRLMPRPKAQAALKALGREARETGLSLPDLVRRDHPDTTGRARTRDLSRRRPAPSPWLPPPGAIHELVRYDRSALRDAPEQREIGTHTGLYGFNRSDVLLTY